MADEFECLEEAAPVQPDRRSFLSAALATVTVAAVTGATAALLLEDDGRPATISEVSIPTPLPPATSTSDKDPGQLRARLAALESENSVLKNSLSAAERQLASYRDAPSESAEADGWREQFEQASAQATDLAGQLAVVQGLLTLYEELEAVDLASVAAGGVDALGGALGDVMADVPSVAEGLEAGRKALEEFEEQLPLVEQGRYWLEGQMTILGSALDTAEATLSNVLKAGGTLLQLLDNWFADILKWLPFGIGQSALAIMSDLSNLTAKVPETMDGLRDNVAGPLDQWLGRDGDEIRLQRRLIKPVREKAIDRADSTVGRLGSVNDVYQAQLREPIATMVERQRTIREQIVLYRQNNSL